MGDSTDKLYILPETNCIIIGGQIVASKELGPVTDWASLFLNLRSLIKTQQELLEFEKELFEKLKKDKEVQDKILRVLKYPYEDGVFLEDIAKAQPLAESQFNFEAATSDKRGERGLVYGINVTFFGEGGKKCRGKMQIDGASLEFEEIEDMHNKGITEPLPVGWYQSSWDTAHHVYGVSWSTTIPVPYNDRFALYLSNHNAKTSAGTYGVTYDIQVSRFVREIVVKEEK